MKRYLRLSLTVVILFCSLPITIGNACSRISAFRLSELFTADLIVRATAIRYVVPPDPDIRTTGVPESTVEFRVEETLWGGDAPTTVVLNAYLSDRDDFNEVPLPYRFVRRGGRSGSCYANSYKKDAQFLLFLKKTFGGYTTNISALGPTNEQLRAPDDPWVKWVKAYLSPCARQNSHDVDYADTSKAELHELMAKRQSDLDKYRLAKCYLVKYGAGGAETAKYFAVLSFYETTPEQK